MPRSSHRCPACNNPLTYIVEDSTVAVFCDVGRCPSPKAADGIRDAGETVDALALKLIEQLKEDQDW